MRRSLAIIGVLMTTLLWAAPAGAEKPDDRVVLKTVTGTLSGLGAGYIAVELGSSGAVAVEEMGFPLDEKLKAQQKDALKDIGLGDTVTVEYQQATMTDPTSGAISVRRVATRVSLVSKAPPQAPQPDVVEDTP